MPSKNIPVNGWPQIKELDKVAPILAELDKIETWQKSVKQETKSGAEVIFTNALELPAVSLSAEIEAEQDLHGQSAPYVGGAGKNKLPLTVANIKAVNGGASSWTGNTKRINNVDVTIQEDDAGNCTGVLLNGTASPQFVFSLYNSAVYTSELKLNGCPSGGATNTYLLQMYNVTDQTYTNMPIDVGAGADFTPDSSKEYRTDIVVRTNQQVNNLMFKPMLRLSTESDASFAPYSNICPISGHTSITITDYDSESNTATVTVQLGQTVYGAEINWDTGVATVKTAFKQYNGDESEAWSYNSTYGFMMIASPTDSAAVSPSGIVAKSNAYNRQAPANVNTIKDGEFFMNTSVLSQTKYLVVKNDAYTDATTWKNYLASNPLQVEYPLATPTTIQLTPEQLTMLKGYNRLSADTGDITVTAYTGNKWN